MTERMFWMELSKAKVIQSTRIKDKIEISLIFILKGGASDFLG
jgi:hypothetical protein